MDGMLRNFWYAVAFADRVTTRPRRVTVLDQQFVLYRTGGGAAALLSDLCVHRGGALSDGWVQGDSVVCPYHGWRYTPDGRCVEIPANPEGRSIPPKARVDSYPVVERYGLVWAFLGDLPEGDRPPMIEIPEHDDPAFVVSHRELSWDVHYARAMEGDLDYAHLPFVHRRTIGLLAEPRIPDYDVTITPWSGAATLSPPADVGVRRSLRERMPVSGALGWHLPHVTRTQIGPSPAVRMVSYAFHIPVDERRTRTLRLDYRNYATSRVFSPLLTVLNNYLGNEDRRAIEGQRPELLPLDLADELHLRSDALQVALRRRLRELRELGWHVGRAQDGDGSVTVGSPARRRLPERNWVRPVAE